MLASEMANSAAGSGLVVHVLQTSCSTVSACSSRVENREFAQELLRAFFDPNIGVALKMMHQKLDAAWTVKKLASACGISRSAFALRF